LALGFSSIRTGSREPVIVRQESRLGEAKVQVSCWICRLMFGCEM
jgi:hypothetical protein